MTTYGEFFKNLDLGEISGIPDSAVVTEAIVIFRYADPAVGGLDGIQWLATEGLRDTTSRVGLLTVVLDRMRDTFTTAWRRIGDTE